MTKEQTNNAEWEVRLKIQFEQRMQDMTEKEKDRIRFWYQSVLDFFSEAISQEKEKWVEEIKKGLLNCPKTDWGDTDEETPDSWEEGYEQCLQDTLDFVNNLLQKQ